MYSPFEDGSVKAAGGGKIEAGGAQGIKANQGYAKILGSDPLNLSIIALGNHPASALPYSGRYACAGRDDRPSSPKCSPWSTGIITAGLQL